MKKVISFLLVAVIFMTALASCGGKDGDATTNKGGPNGTPTVYTELPEGMSGKEAAMLMLANQRLNSKYLKDSENIFEDGATTLTNLAAKAEESLVEYTYLASSRSNVTPLASVTHTNSDGSTVEINGNDYRWGNFVEYSNQYDYFLNLTNNISSSAKQGAELIDNVKKYVRVVDKWINIYGIEYYLHVEENCEILFERMPEQTQMCMRTKTESGKNRYDLYTFNDNGQTRMVYIEGRLCEYSHVSNGSFNHNFLAENTKGFWEVVDVGVLGDNRYNVICIVLKDDICYQSSYDLDNAEGKPPITVISPDRKTDIMSYTEYPGGAHVNIALQGFTGYKYVEGTFLQSELAPWGNDSSNPAMYYNDTYYEDHTVYGPLDSSRLSLVLNNGKTLKANDTLLNGNLTVSQILVSHSSKESGEGADAAGKYTDGYSATLSIVLQGNTTEEIWANLDAFLKETGLECRRDMSYVKNGVVKAQMEVSQFVKNHEWNESPIYTKEDLATGWQNNLAKHAALKAKYEQVKNAEVLDFSNKELIELNIKFAPITSQKAANVANDGFIVNVKDLELSVEDTMLFVEGEKYVVNFALVKNGEKSSAELIHIELAEGISVEFKGGKSFTVKQTASFEIPTVDFKIHTPSVDYDLVAYIATADGIRASKYTELIFTKSTPAERNVAATNVFLATSTDKKILVCFSENREIEVTLSEGAKTNAEVYEELSGAAYEYGFINNEDKLEMLAEEEKWVDAPQGEDPLPSGTYRVKFYVGVDANEHGGHVYVKYTAK